MPTRAAGRRDPQQEISVQTLEDLKKRVGEVFPVIFDQAQASVASHQKNWVALHKLHLNASTVINVPKDGPAKGKKGASGHENATAGLNVFHEALMDMVNHALELKKGSGGGVGERLVKFVSGYVRYVNEKVTEESEDDDETYASVFVAHFVKYLLQGFVAKDKVVRYRCVQLVAESVAFLGAIDEHLYLVLREALVSRTLDKEASVRTQVVVALGKLLPADEPSTHQESLVDILVDMLQFDPAGDVRRAALLSLPLKPPILPHMLTRTRDTDVNTRKALYSLILSRLKPAHLTAEQIGRIVLCGLRDREESVKTAARALVSNWLLPQQAADTQGEAGEVDSLSLFLDFVQLFDLGDSLEPLELALVCAFELKRELYEKLDFSSERFWMHVSSEKAILARVFVEHCQRKKDEARMERCLPVITALAFKVQDECNELPGLIDAGDEEALAEQAFVVGEMLKMVADLDYADEIGRRKMFALVREMLSLDTLPESLIARCMDVLRVLSASERDLIRVVVEIVHELRDPAEPENDAAGEDDTMDSCSQSSMTPTRKIRKPAVPVSEMNEEDRERQTNLDLRSLALCIAMLERVNGTFEENSTLEGILADLIIPAVKRKETLLRERGLIGLGLCCLIAKRMALNSFQLFLGQIQSAPESLKVRVLQIAFDIMMVHESEFLGPRSVVGEGRMVEFLLHTLESTESNAVQSAVCMGLAKLMLAGMISDERVLQSLLLAYISPQTADNQELRQCLAYFIPVFCFSSSSNQRRMQQIALPMFSVLSKVRQDLDEELVMIGQSQVGDLLMEWTNPEHLFEIPGQKHDEQVQVDLAADIVKALYNDEVDAQDKKVLCQMLQKTWLPLELDDDKLRTLVVLMSNLHRRRPLRDASARAAFERFEKSVTKKYSEQLENVSEEEYRKLDHLTQLFEFLDSIEPDEEEEVPPKKTNGRARSKSAHPAQAPITPKRKVKAKRAEASGSESEDGSERVSTRASPTPSRARLPRSAAPKKFNAGPASGSDDSDDDDDDEDEEDDDAPPRESHERNNARSRSAATEQESDEADEDDVDELLNIDEQSEDDEDIGKHGDPGSQSYAKLISGIAKRRERGDAATTRTPNYRPSKKQRMRSPPGSPSRPPKTPVKASEAAKRVRSEIATGTPSPPRKKLKEVTNGAAARSNPAAAQRQPAPRKHATLLANHSSDDLNIA